MQHKINLVLLGLLVFTLNQGCAQNTDQKADSKEKGAANESAGTNNLADATSPYLRQHADNPVNWYKWGDKAFEKAKKQNKLVIISIGYAACHWCHVMEHESFMDSSVAQYMNDHFVAIKVDREQRPDVDDIYMTAARLTSKSGGWPLNAIALPNGKPVVAGTYFPKDKWLRFLKRMQRVYNNNPKRLRQQAQKVTQGIRRQSFIEPAKKSKDFTMKDLDRYFNNHLVTDIDWEIEYGDKKAQKGNKFPNASNFAFQLHYYHLSGNEKALGAVTTTLDQMLKGGIYDQIGGGFSRYSTDQMWKVPHFEKMLYDNAQLVSLYSRAYKVTGHERYKRVVTQTLDFIDRVMTSPEGGFYSSLNADSEGEEGKYYVWTEAQIDEVLDEHAEMVKDYYNVKPDGNWEHDKNVLFRKKADQAFAQEKGMSVENLREIIDKARKQLFEARQPRTMPSKDDKVLTSWNALMLQGYLDAYEAFGKQAYLDKALKNARFLDKNLIQDDFSVKRVYKDGQANIEGFLDDYSYVINAFIQVYEVTMDKKWLEKAEKLADYTLENFYDPSTGLFFYKAKHSEALIAEQRDMTDNTKPSGNSSMANALLKLSKYYYEEHAGYADTAQQMLSTVSQKMDRAPAHFANWLTLMSYFAEPTFEVAIMGEQYHEKGKELRGHYLPHAFFMGSQQAENLPLLKNRYVEGQTTIYVCRNQVCQLPVTEVDKALGQIDEMLNAQKEDDD